jgi:hydroxymethylglutaryl-CoA reductase (NADPH)
MATTEGALIASYQRGMRALTQAGGASVQVLAQRVQRAPLFRLQEVTQALQLAQWVVERLLQCQDIAAQHSRYGRLQEIRPLVEGNQLWLTFHFSTADAAGQNMVTICTEAICRWIARQAPVVIEDWYLDGNLSGDKKATHRALMDARGYRVAAESVLPPEVLQRILSVEAAQMERCWRGGVLGAIQSGANGALAHAANGLAALFLATGQDVACVAEAANGVLRMEARPDGSLYVAVTLPNLIVGSVGGGGNLPTQRDCLAMIGCHGPGHGPHLAEIAAGTVLAGEVSLTAAMAGGHFGRAHALLGRPRS